MPMFTKRKLLMYMFYLPGIVFLIRAVFTVWTLGWNPLGLRLPYIQLIPLAVMGASCFGHFKLYRDAVPVISLIVPTLLHAVMVFVFTKTVMVVPLLPVFAPDVVYLIVKSVKANMFPFYIEGEDDDFPELNLSNEKAG